MEKIKVDSIAEYKLYQKAVDSTKKIVNIVGISSYIFGSFSTYLTQNVLYTDVGTDGHTERGLLIYVVLLVVYVALMIIINRGLNKYKNIE